MSGHPVEGLPIHNWPGRRWGLAGGRGNRPRRALARVVRELGVLELSPEDRVLEFVRLETPENASHSGVCRLR
ncbi:hypothetical protein [Amycolatopsis orientalis]|uniref:hypothetical protein n=1 Tax=Amycolatopsis orientalis TaxID=31958 RepID=UPI0005CEFF1F|nr:hypothetical protein [Amycolatopsis orientalis]